MLAEAHLSAIVQSSDDAIISKNLEGIVVSWNPAATRIFGWEEAEMVGQSIRRLIPPDRQSEEDDILARIGRGERVKSFETIRVRKDGRKIRVSLTVSPIFTPDGMIMGASKIARDVTERHAADLALRDTDLRLRMLADNISQLAWIAAPDGGLTWYNKRWYDYTGTTFGTMQGWGWQAIHHPDHVERVTEKFRGDIEAGREWEDTFPLRGADGQYCWFLSRAKPIRDQDGQIAYWFGTNTDVTELLQKEEQIRVLLMEVNHRSKNMLAVVQALARRSGGTDPAFLERFENRLTSLSANQDLLVRRGWATIPMDELAEAQLAILGREHRAQVRVEGPPIDLSPRSAEIIGMALHELATNALKYGALSRPSGRVRLEWQESDGRFRIAWSETAGPPVQAPDGTGFGTTLIRHIPARSLLADVTLDYDPAGLRWSLDCDATKARTLNS
ncbi:sensor histidine kinase [Novosphingobium cyanobacteriorum]|uniref:histidine kinase n=1 Tax=Novosphingobium cyanobacteriorum TaxID=3024215 RepID=A0ABT6CGU5_9SPHN|nr:PAS domain S-box protein [Novosphingobium cyanobacteriorum]MDF8332693.1 PAS domain S-box protein [Novosphingobium cyanobacteriorum]